MFYYSIEESIKKIGNRFDLILIAAHRARQLQNGSKKSFCYNNNDKYIINALREIEMGYIKVKKNFLTK